MKDIISIFKFELTTRLKQKSFRIITILMVLVVFCITAIPTVISIVSKDGADAAVQASAATRFGYVLGDFPPQVLQSVTELSGATAFQTEAALRSAIEAGEIDHGMIMQPAGAFTFVAKDISMFDTTAADLALALKKGLQDQYLMQNGIDPVLIRNVEAIQVGYEIESIGKNASYGFVFAYAGVFVVFLLVAFYGVSVSMVVAREKNDRTMEILITNTTARSLILGKVLASAVLSALQLLLVIAVAAGGVLLNIENYPKEMIAMFFQGVTSQTVAVFLLFAITGTILYYFLYAAAGALANRVEDANQLMMPIQLLFVISFFLSAAGMLLEDSQSLLYAISYIPFTSPMAMFVRATLTTVPFIDILLSYLLLLVSTALFAFVSIRIYRIGSLNYGNKLTFPKVVRILIKRHA